MKTITASDLFPFTRFFVSSKVLLKHAIGVAKIHSDATYKLIWQNYPVFQIGTSDMNRKFHPFGIAVCTHETTKDFEFIFKSLKEVVAKQFDVELKPRYLIADAAKSIHNAFTSVFRETTTIMCWFHMRKAVVKRMESQIRDRHKQTEFLADLDKLQLSPSSEIFGKASKLFCEKWHPHSRELIDYFRDEWLIQNRNWYEGIAKRVPSTNNALESSNRLIKDEQTLRERMDIAQFRVKLFEMVKQWSTMYESGLNDVNNNDPKIDLKLWTDGYNWAKSNVKFKSLIVEDRTIHRPAISRK